MPCPFINEKKAKKAVEKSRKQGKETGYVICRSGKKTNIQEGKKDNITLKSSCGNPETIFHTHTNNLLSLSKNDEKLFNKTKTICVADLKGKIKCFNKEDLNCQQKINLKN